MREKLSTLIMASTVRKMTTCKLIVPNRRPTICSGRTYAVVQYDPKDGYAGNIAQVGSQQVGFNEIWLWPVNLFLSE